jgi:hypothetical protein
MPSQFEVSGDATKVAIKSKWPSGLLILLSTLIGLAGGILVWALSQSLTNHVEPWDAEGFYSTTLLLVGGLGGLVSGRHGWAAVFGAYWGQVLYCSIAIDPHGAIILPIYIAAAIFGGIPSLIGAVVGGSLHEILRAIAFRCRTKSKPPSSGYSSLRN